MPAAASTPSPPSLLRRPGFWITVMAAVPGLMATVYLVENTFGKRALLLAKSECAAAGWSMDPASFRRPFPPDEENFAATPLLIGIGQGMEGDPRLDPAKRVSEWLSEMTKAGLTLQEPHSPAPTRWNDVHQLLSQNATWPLPDPPPDDPAEAVAQAVDHELAPITAELKAALVRPAAVFKPAYFDGTGHDYLEGPSRRSFISLLTLSNAYRLRASAAISRGEGPAVAESCRIILRLAAALEIDSPLVPSLIANSLRRNIINITWAATQARTLSADDYRQLSQALHHTRPLESIPSVLHAEAVGGQIVHEFLRSDPATYMAAVHDPYDLTRTLPSPWHTLAAFIPPGWFDANQASSLRLSHRLLERLQDTSIPHRFHLKQWLADEIATPNPFPFHRQTIQSNDFLVTPIEGVISVEALCRLAEAACALEAHLAEHGKLPAVLQDLVPGFLPAVPVDLDGQPVRFREHSPRRYQLWSVGGDGIDQGGTEKPAPSPANTWRWKSTEADWVWASPE